jgi:hypothetical protein
MIGLDISVKDSSDQDRLTAFDRMPTDWLETVGTVFDLANENSPYKSIKRAIQRDFASHRDDEIIPMAELNEKYAPLGLTFMEDHKKGYADLIVKKKLDDIEKQNIISRGPKNIFAKGSYFISGLGGSFTDPINIGTSLIPVVGQARFIQMVGQYGKTSARLRRGAIEGGVGNTLFEPLEIAMARSEQRDYGAIDSLYNIAFGALLGAGLNVGLGKVGDVYKKYTGKDNIYNDIENAPAELKEDLIRYSVGQLVQGKRINASKFLEETKIERDRQTRLKQISEANLKANLGSILDVDAQPKTKDLKGIKEFNKKLQENIDSGLSKVEKTELQKLKKIYGTIEKNLQEKKYTKLKKSIEEKEEIDLEIVNKDKTLIPYIAKLDSINKKIKVLEDRGQSAFIRNFIKQQQESKQKGSNVGYNTLSKIESLKTIYSNPDGFEIKNNKIVERANKINLNEPSDVGLILQDIQTRFNVEGKGSDYRSAYAREIDSDNLEIETKFDLNKVIDVNNEKDLQSEINILTNEFTGLETLARDKYPAIIDYLDSYNSTIKEIDKSLNKQNDIFKGIKVGLSCLIKKGS